MTVCVGFYGACTRVCVSESLSIPEPLINENVFSCLISETADPPPPSALDVKVHVIALLQGRTQICNLLPI